MQIEGAAQIETDRCVIRPWREEDAPRLLDILSRLEVVTWLGDGEPKLMADVDEARARIGPSQAVCRRLGKEDLA